MRQKLLSCLTKTLVFLFLGCLGVNVYAQNRTISGRVVDASGEPVIGAAVTVVGNSRIGGALVGGILLVRQRHGAVEGEGGFGGGRNEATFLKVKKGFARGMVVEGFDAEVAGEGEEEGYR